MSGQHTLRHKPIRLGLPARPAWLVTPTFVKRLPWQWIRGLLLDVADVLWRCALAAVGCGLAALVIILLANGVYQSTGERTAAALVLAWGFREIVGLLIAWAARAVNQ